MENYGGYAVLHHRDLLAYMAIANQIRGCCSSEGDTFYRYFSAPSMSRVEPLGTLVPLHIPKRCDESRRHRVSQEEG